MMTDLHSLIIQLRRRTKESVLDGSLRHYNSRLIFRYLLHNSQHILNIFLLESLVTAIFGLFNLYRGLGHSNLML